jgi:disulfide bond formation protein DsbB
MDVVVDTRPAIKADQTMAENGALGLAVVALLGSLYLSLGMGLIACPFCLYERTFLLSVVGVLTGGKLLRLPVANGILSLMALPLALGGLGVAAIQTNLVRADVLACPNGILGLGPAPFQSLGAFLLITALLIPGATKRGISPVESGKRIIGMVALGMAFAAIAVISAPPVPPFKPTFNEAGVRVLNTCERAKPEAIAPR